MSELNNVVNTAINADFSKYVYTNVYASANATPTINGTLVTMAAGSLIKVLVKSISATPNIYLLGQKRLVVPEVFNGSFFRPFIITVKTDNAGTSSATQFTIPTNPRYKGIYDVETSDGQVYKNINGNTTLTFPTAGTYDIKISGNFASIFFNNGGDKDKLLDIKQWGDVVWRSMSRSFRGCTSLTNITAKDAPVLSSFKFERLIETNSGFVGYFDNDLRGTFRDCTGLTNINFMANWDISQVRVLVDTFTLCTAITDWSALANWDTSNVISLAQLFTSSSFDDIAMQYISNWDVSNVESLVFTFYSLSITSLLPIANWNTGKVKDMTNTFRLTSTLTSLEGLENWDVSNVTNMSSTFERTNITTLSALTNWDVSNVTNMISTFREIFTLTSLVGLENWDVSNVTNMGLTFYDSPVTTLEPLRNWNTGKVKDMQYLFSRLDITESEPVENWDTKNVVNMQQVFWNSISLVSSDLSKWNVSNVKNMLGIFADIGGSLLEVNISGWDTRNVTTFQGLFELAPNLSNVIGIEDLDTSSNKTIFRMFEGCDLFDQDISSWDITNVTDLRNFMLNATGLSTTNYDKLLIGWEATLQTKYPDGVGYPVSALRTPNFGGSIYTLGGAAEAARQSLITNYAWAITDGGGI